VLKIMGLAAFSKTSEYAFRLRRIVMSNGGRGNVHRPHLALCASCWRLPLLPGNRNLKTSPLPTWCRVALSFRFGANQVVQVKATIVGLVTPHFLRVTDLAKQAETGVNVDWHLRDTVAKTIDDLAHQYNARDLISAYIQGLETATHDTERISKVYVSVLQAAVAIAKKRSGNMPV
jgi:hypothetical protein